jgi:hypothetical protein
LVPAFFAVGGAVVAVIWKLIGLGNFPSYLRVGVGLVIGGAIFGLIAAIHHRSMRVGSLEQAG